MSPARSTTDWPCGLAMAFTVFREWLLRCVMPAGKHALPAGVNRLCGEYLETS